MRLAKHSLPKEVHKHAQTVKHKKSAKKLERLEAKRRKVVSLNTVDMEGETPPGPGPLSEEERRRKREERKKANAHKNLYKKQHLSFSAKNGPRAINRGSI